MSFSSVSAAVGAQRAALGAVFAFSFILNLLLLVSPLYMMLVFDHVLTSRSVDTLLVLSLLAAMAVLFHGAFDVLRAQILARVALTIEAGLSPSVTARALSLARKTPAGTTAHALRDLATLRGLFTGGGALAVIDSPWTLLFAASLFILHPLLGLAGMLAAAALLLVAAAGEGIARRPLRQAQRLAPPVVDWTELVARQADSIAGLGMSHGVERELRQRGAALAVAQLATADRSAAAGAAARGVRMLAQMAIIALGASLVLRHELGAGGMVAASLLLARMLAPIESAIANARLFAQARIAWRRLEQLLALPDPRPGAVRPGARGGLTVEGLSYLAPGAREPTLRQISFRLEPGEVLGLLGPSAAGKSILARLLVGGLAPGAGQLRLDGVDIGLWPQGERGRRLGYLPQQAVLFPGSVAQNIAGFDEASAETVAAAAMLAGMHERILDLPRGYDSPVEGDGAALAGGLRQGIALARAFFGSPPLIVLDEPALHLDGGARDALLGALAALKAAGTMLVIVTREPLLLERADKLALLNHGQISAFGPRTEVLSRLGAALPDRRSAPAQVVSGGRRLA